MAHQLAIVGGRIFDGDTIHDGKAALFDDDIFKGIVDTSSVPKDYETIDLQGDILSPGFVDLQVNGGDGIMLGDDPSVEGLTRITNAHRRLGVTKLLPTLITDRPQTTQKVLDAVQQAISEKIPGIVGVHLEGPHISVARKGAHDEKYIRTMLPEDVELLLSAKTNLPVLKVTLAPENTTQEQVSLLSRAGILVSLGHTNADFATCQSYIKAGASCATHLFNAMSQLGNREPGLVGAALESGELSTGLIADGIHVHPATMRAAWAAKSGPGKIFLVSDAMAVAGTDIQEFTLGGRIIQRKNGELRLSNGTLAGADLELIRAVSVLKAQVGVELSEALAAATTTPARLCNIPDYGLIEGVTRLDDLIRIRRDLSNFSDIKTKTTAH